MGLLFSRRRVPSCRRHAFRAEKEVGASLRPLPCPVGARGAAGVRVRRCLPCGAKALQSWRAGFWSVHGKEFFAGRFAHQETFPARRGTELRGTSHRFCFSRRISGARHTVETVFSPFTSFSCPQKANFPPSPPRLLPQTIPRGERRALPAPAQGSKPLRIPFWKVASVSPQPPSPNRRRQTAPARGPSAVYAFCRRNRNETKRPCPLLVGRACVESEPTAPAGGTAAS